MEFQEIRTGGGVNEFIYVTFKPDASPESVYAWTRRMNYLAGVRVKIRLHRAAALLSMSDSDWKHNELGITVTENEVWTVYPEMVVESIADLRALITDTNEGAGGKDTEIQENEQIDADGYDLAQKLHETLIEVGVERYYVNESVAEELEERVRLAKKDLVAALDLHPLTMRRRFTAILPVTSREHIPPKVRHWIRELEIAYSFSFHPAPPAVCHKDGKNFKATRYLKNLVETHQIVVKENVLTDARAMTKEGELRIEIFWSKLGEILNSPSLTMYLSANPCDIITASHNGGFSSCLRPGGEYFASTASYALDSISTLCYIGTPRRKYGRAFVYKTHPEFLSFLFGNGYGSFPDYMREVGRHAIENTIAKYHGIPSHWLLKGASLGSHSRMDEKVYFDGDDAEYLRHVSLQDTAKNAPMPDLIYAPCVICNGEVLGRECIVCPEHGGDRDLCCERCGDGVCDDDAIWVDDEAFCSSCFNDRFFYCHCCDEATHNDYMVTVRGTYGSEYYCEGCASDLSSCDHCGNVYAEDAATLYEDENGDQICNHCASRNGYSECSECGAMSREPVTLDGDEEVCQNCKENHETCVECTGLVSETIDETGLCEDCHGEKYAECEECAENILQADLNDDGVCKDCAASQTDEEAV